MDADVLTVTQSEVYLGAYGRRRMRSIHFPWSDAIQTKSDSAVQVSPELFNDYQPADSAACM